jgi:hypothetical protein
MIQIIIMTAKALGRIITNLISNDRRGTELEWVAVELEWVVFAPPPVIALRVGGLIFPVERRFPRPLSGVGRKPRRNALHGRARPLLGHHLHVGQRVQKQGHQA